MPGLNVLPHVRGGSFSGGSAVAFLCAVGGEGSYMSIFESKKNSEKKSIIAKNVNSLIIINNHEYNCRPD